MSSNLLWIKHLSISHVQSGKRKLILDDINLRIKEGEFVALMGMSGIGKSLTTQAILGLLTNPCWEVKGDIIFYKKRNRVNGKEDVYENRIRSFEEEEWTALEKYIMKDGKYNRKVIAELRGKSIFTVFQEPGSYLHPSFSAGYQLKECVDIPNRRFVEAEIKRRLKEVELGVEGDIGAEARKYPHQFSHGQQQRIMIAMALNEPELLIADEPTSSLDVIVQKGIITLLRNLRQQGEINSMLLITHDLRVVKELLREDDSIFVMDRDKDGHGKVVDQITIRDVFSSFNRQRFHPLVNHDRYNFKKRELFSDFSKKEVILTVRGLRQIYRESLFGKAKIILKDVNFSIKEEQFFGLVGISGCGKSTLAKAILRLLNNTTGEIIFSSRDGKKDLLKLQPNGLMPDCLKMRIIRRDIQMLPQDAASAFNPNMTIGEILYETLELLGIEKDEEIIYIERCLNQVRIIEEGDEVEAMLERYPGELSGGQKQRLLLARVLLTKPRLIIADEPFANQDIISSQNLIQLMDEIRRRYGVAFIIISHDLNLIRNICDEIAIMKDGSIIKVGAPEEIFEDEHPYIRKLVEGVSL